MFRATSGQIEYDMIKMKKLLLIVS
ncbi:MAG: DUF1349 domain-containing protein, partial [Flavobacterium sp.]